MKLAERSACPATGENCTARDLCLRMIEGYDEQASMMTAGDKGLLGSTSNFLAHLVGAETPGERHLKRVNEVRQEFDGYLDVNCSGDRCVVVELIEIGIDNGKIV